MTNRNHPTCFPHSLSTKNLRDSEMVKLHSNKGERTTAWNMNMAMQQLKQTSQNLHVNEFEQHQRNVSASLYVFKPEIQKNTKDATVAKSCR